MSGIRHFFLLSLPVINIFLLSVAAVPVEAQETQWKENIFVEISAIHYFTPGLLEGHVKPEIGFRAAVGYDWNNFLFSIESGYSYITGTNPLVLEISMVPLYFNFGYHWRFFSIFGLQGNLGMGFAFSGTLHYETVIDMLMSNLSDDDETSFFTAARIYFTVSPYEFLKFFAGGGIDIIFEAAAPIPLPLIQIGVSVKPFAAAFHVENQRRQTALNTVYFIKNTSYIDEKYVSILDKAGEELKENPQTRITLRAYHAPRFTKEWQVKFSTGEPALSVARARYCEEYLAQNYGIELSRMKIQYRDGRSANNLYRCVEIIVR